MRKYNYSLIKKTTERFGLARGTADIEYPLGSADGSVTLARLLGNTVYSSEENAYLSVGDKTDAGKYSLSFSRPGRNLMNTRMYGELHRVGATGYTILNDTNYYIVAAQSDDGKTIISQENIAFKPNTVYTFAARMRYNSSNKNYSPFQAKVVYTDGTEDPIRFPVSGTDIYGIFSSAEGKSIDRIAHHRDNSAPTKIMMDTFGIFEGAYSSYDEAFEPYGSFEGALILDEPLRSVGYVSDILDLCSLTVKRKICETVIDGSESIDTTDHEGIFKVYAPFDIRPDSPIISSVRKRSFEELLVSDSGAVIDEDGKGIYIKLMGISALSDFIPRVTESPVKLLMIRKDYADESVSGDPIISESSGARVSVTTQIPPKKQIMIYKRKD